VAPHRFMRRVLISDPVVVFAPNWLGDAVMALPAIADVRRSFPSARLVIAARASVASLFQLVPAIDEIVTLRWRGRVLDHRTRRADIGTLRGLTVSSQALAILLPNSFGTAWLAKQARFAERWGYARDMRGVLLTRSVIVPRDSMHQGRYYQQLVAGLGLANGPLEPCVEVSAALRHTAREQLTAAGWDGRQPLVTMAPGAAYGTAKRWLPAHFATVIGDLARRGVRTALVGSAADAETIRTIVTASDVPEAPPIDLGGRTSLQELAGVIAVSAACLSNDSGAMHLAGAIGTPIVALFGPTRDAETAPLTRAGAHRDVLFNPVGCRPCMLRDCPIDHRCMRGLEPSRVTAALAVIVSAGTDNPDRSRVTA
jgi:heptosyltransferase II